MSDSTKNWTPDPILVREVEDQFDRAIASYRADPKLVIEHANLEESIRTGGYANRTLLELVQNAADAMSGTAAGFDEELGRVEIVLDPQSRILYCANSGRPFAKHGLDAMSHAYLSAKRGDEIGRFGLGFKSVLAVTDSPQVLSRSISFEYNSARATENIRAVGASSRRLPALRTATVLDAEALISADPILVDLGQWATTIIRLPGLEGIERLQTEMKNFASEFLLFVRAVREVHLRVLGSQGFETSHVSRDLGADRFKIERPDGSGDEWLLGERMHSPSMAARREVGEAVSREEIKVSVAVPLRPRRANTDSGDPGTQIGQFWSYFPLQDRTSATGLFNAPWSVNDDRTTLLRNNYNREILQTLAEMFVEILPGVVTSDDPAALLDYLPARGREATFFGDEVLCALVPRLAVVSRVVPNARGALSPVNELRPLDLTSEWKTPEKAHEAWVASPNTADDVPHWRCYNSPQRIARLRQLFAVSVDPDRFEDDGRDVKRALELLPKRGVLSWLREWADGDDVESAANALKVVIANRHMPEADQAKVIPTSHGMKSIGDKSLVFLHRAEDLEIDAAVFVKPTFLEYPEIEQFLRDAGFRDLDPVAVLNARIAQLSGETGIEYQVKFWDAVMEVSSREAIAAIRGNRHAKLLVPTRDGGWAWPQQVVDLDEQLSEADGDRLLDRNRCLPELAHVLGVVKSPRPDYSYEDEFAAAEYQSWVLEELNARLASGDRPIKKISLYPSGGTSAGPFSVLILLASAGATDSIRESWTRGLLEFEDAPWDCEDSATGVSYRIQSPVRWAVERYGVLRSSRGFVSPTQLVSPSLVQYRALLPLFEGSRGLSDTLRLPDVLSEVAPDVLRGGLATDLLPPNLEDSSLAEFIIEASRLGYPGGQPPKVPARVGRLIESRPTSSVYVAVTDEQRDYLAQRQRPYLFATDTEAVALIDQVGCLRFEDSFAFSIRIEGEQDAERLLDLFSGLRGWPTGEALTSATIVRAETIAKWVTTEDGVEAQSLDAHRDGSSLIIAAGLDERRTLAIVSEKFDLGLTNADIEFALKVGLDHHLDLLRQDALSAKNDIERIEIYFGEDDLREKLPKGLWQGLEAQGLISKQTSAAELCLSVYGRDTIKELADLFRREGFPDVPAQWVGGGATISWLRKMGFTAEFAGQRTQKQDAEFVVPGATILPALHDYQALISQELRTILLEVDTAGRRAKAMVELPTGAGKTRVATQTILQLFIDGHLKGPVLWIAQSQELCEQAVQTFSEVWRGLCTDLHVDRPLTIGRLWEGNDVQEPDTELSVTVATDAKLEVILGSPEYEWLSEPSAVFVDEGHVAGTSTRYTRLFTWLGVDGRSWSRPLVGLSATPFKGTSVQATDQLAARFGRRKLAAFEENSYQELVSRGVLARVKHSVLKGANVRLSEVEQLEARRTNRISGQVLDRVAADHARMAVLVNSIIELPPDRGRSVLVFTPNVLSAQVLAATLRFRGIAAASVSGQTGRQERRDVIDRFKNEEIQVLANCDLLTQGFDAPGVTSLYIARPTFSPNAYIQMAGRGLRGPKNGGKEECLIVDMADNFGSTDINNLLGFRDYEDLWKEQQS